MAKGNHRKENNDSGLNFEVHLWAAADKMRGHMDASEYKHVCLGLIFLKYISDAFEEKREQLLFGFSDPKSEWFNKDEPERAGAAENRDEYLAANVFWLPPEARWHTIKARAKSPEIGKVIDDGMGAIERENPTLKGVLPCDYARPSLDKVRLGGLMDIISNIGFNESASRSKDVLGRVYEYFLGKFASAEGKGGGEFYTPQCVVQVLVSMLEPFKGRVFDPCCGSGGMFVSSKKFVEKHGGRVGDIAVYGQDKSVRGQRRFGLPKEARRVSARRSANQSNYTTLKLGLTQNSNINKVANPRLRRARLPERIQDNSRVC